MKSNKPMLPKQAEKQEPVSSHNFLQFPFFVTNDKLPSVRTGD